MFDQHETQVLPGDYLCELTKVNERLPPTERATLTFRVCHGPCLGQEILYDTYESQLLYRPVIGRKFLVRVALRGTPKSYDFMPSFCRLLTDAETRAEAERIDTLQAARG